MFLHNFRQFLENLIFDGNSTGADLTKIVKILYYLKLCLEKSFCLNYLLPSTKEVFLHNCLEKSFCLNYLLPSTKEVFLFREN